MAKCKKKKPRLVTLFTLIIISALIAAFLTPMLRLVYPLEYKAEIEEYAREYDLDIFLVMGIISTESGFDVDAESHKAARGLMQVKDDTALWCVEQFGMDIPADDINTPKSNIRIGCAYMRYLTDRYGGNTLTAIAAYNAGPGNVDKWLSDPRYSDGGSELSSIPFSETAAYVKKVQKRAKIYKKLYE